MGHTNLSSFPRPDFVHMNMAFDGSGVHRIRLEWRTADKALNYRSHVGWQYSTTPCNSTIAKDDAYEFLAAAGQAHGLA